jgi:hypothetical protein
MQFITKKQDLVDNALIFEGYLKGKDKAQKEFAENLFMSSTAFSVYKVKGENHFAPNDFLAFKKNSMKDFLKNAEKEDRDTKSTVTKIIGAPFANDTIESKFKAYAESLGLKASADKRTYWRVKDERGKNLDIK